MVVMVMMKMALMMMKSLLLIEIAKGKQKTTRYWKLALDFLATLALVLVLAHVLVLAPTLVALALVFVRCLSQDKPLLLYQQGKKLLADNQLVKLFADVLLRLLLVAIRW